MKTQKTTNKMRHNFIWILTNLMLIGLLGIAHMSLAAGGIWTRKADMPTARCALSASVVDGIIYAIGGTTDSLIPVVTMPTVEAYDPATNTWIKKADMPTARGWLSTSVVDGIIYAIGGMVDSTFVGVSTVEAYDPATNTWATKASMPTPRWGLSTSVVDGIIYAIGGTLGPGVNFDGVSTVEAYDSTTDTWIKKVDMPTPRVGASTIVVNGKIYAIGGAENIYAPSLPTVEVYDPATDTWTRKADIPTPRMLFSTSVVDGIIYAIGGSHGWDGSIWPGISTVEAYDPLTDTWTKKLTCQRQEGGYPPAS